MIKKEDIDNRVVAVAVVTTLVTMAVAVKLFMSYRKTKREYARRGDDMPVDNGDLNWEDEDEQS